MILSIDKTEYASLSALERALTTISGESDVKT